MLRFSRGLGLGARDWSLRGVWALASPSRFVVALVLTT